MTIQTILLCITTKLAFQEAINNYILATLYMSFRYVYIFIGTHAL